MERIDACLPVLSEPMPSGLATADHDVAQLYPQLLKNRMGHMSFVLRLATSDNGAQSS
jgi:hypothetical protein